MQQILIDRSQLKLSEKAEQLECGEHRRPITLVYLDQQNKNNSKLGCSECRANSDSIIFQVNKIEDCLNNWYQDEQNQIQRIISTFSNLIRVGQDLEKKFNSYILQQIQTLEKEKQNFIQSTQFTFIQETISQIANQNRVDQDTFQKIIYFLSNQEIFNNSIELKEKTDFIQFVNYPLIEPSENIINISQALKYITESDLGWQLQVQQFIQQFQLLQLNINIPQPINVRTDLSQYVNYEGNSQLIDDNSSNIYALAISQDDIYIASGDINITLWNLQEKRKLIQYQCSKRISFLAFSKNSKLLAASLFEFNKQSIDISLFNLEILNYAKPIQKIYHQGNNIGSLLFSNDSKYLIAGGSLRVWDLERIECIGKQEITTISSIAISSNQKYLICGCQVAYGKAYLLNCENFENLQQITDWKSCEKTTATYTIAIFSPDDLKIIIGSDGIKIWSVERLIQQIIDPIMIIKTENSIRSMQLAFNGNIIIRQDNQSIQFYNSQNGNQINRIGAGDWKILKALVTRNMKVLVFSHQNLLIIYKNSMFM